MSKVKPTTIDQYLAGVRDDQRVALEKLRKTIRAAAPLAEECISYGIPAFRNSRMLVGFGATAKHCALYLMSASILDQFVDEVQDFGTSKGTIRFFPDQPLPASLVQKLVKARLAENKGMDLNQRGSPTKKPGQAPERT